MSMTKGRPFYRHHFMVLLDIQSLKELSNNALSIVSELGPADVFITLTCNPQWEKIQSRLLPGQTAFDRPDIVCQVEYFFNILFLRY